MINFEFRNFDPSFVDAIRTEAISVAKLIFADGTFPPTNSDPVYVDRIENGSARLVAGEKDQIIQVCCPHHLTWQFIYQFSHELGHLATRADNRFSEAGYHSWIEEALCGACSVFITDRVVKTPLFTDAEVAECTEHIRSNYSRSDVNANWYSQNAISLRGGTDASPLTRKLAGWIANRFPEGAFLPDNRALKDVPLNSDLEIYLSCWSAKCGREANVAGALRGLVGKIKPEVIPQS